MLVGIALADGSFLRKRRHDYRLADLLGCRTKMLLSLSLWPMLRLSFSRAGTEVRVVDTVILLQVVKRRSLKLPTPHWGLTRVPVIQRLNGVIVLNERNHPDKLMAEGVPDELLKVATERFRKSLLLTTSYRVLGV